MMYTLLLLLNLELILQSAVRAACPADVSQEELVVTDLSGSKFQVGSTLDVA